jgi:FAD-dependent urate hydroxylase
MAQPNSLAELELIAQRDLALLNLPQPNWVLASVGFDLDVLVVGAGMCGQTATFALMREGVRNLRCIDRASAGQEGPWATFARMETLRSPKHLNGPDLGIASLTCRAWFEARHGAAGE